MESELELSDHNDTYDEYFGDDDDRDPDYFPLPKKRKKISSRHQHEPSVESKTKSSSSEDEKESAETILIWDKTKPGTYDYSSHGNIDQNRSTNESSSSDFDLPVDYLNVNTRKSESKIKSLKKRKINEPEGTEKSKFKERKRRRKKVQSKEETFDRTQITHTSKKERKLQTLDYGKQVSVFANLDALLSKKFDNHNSDEKKRNVEYISTILESSEQNYILDALPIIFNRTLLNHLKLLIPCDRTGQIHFINFCFGVRKYLETVMNTRDERYEHLSKKCDDAFRHLAVYKEQQFCLMLACHYFAQSQIVGDMNGDWCMKRFCEITKSALQRIKPVRGQAPRLVELSEDMRAILQIFQKVVSIYEDFKKATKDLDISENGSIDLEDSQSLSSGKSGFSVGSQGLQNYYEDSKYDKNDHTGAEKRMNFLASLEIPDQLFTATNFDWAAKMYYQSLEDMCDSGGDYTGLSVFQKALQYRVDQNKLPESRQIKSLLSSFSERENKFISSKSVLENQLQNGSPLNETEIQRAFNILEDFSHQVENEMVAEDSMSDYLSDHSDHNSTVHPRIFDDNGIINQKNWLLQQYRSLGSKVVLQLDNKPIRKNGLYTLLGSTFRSVMMNLIRYAEDDTEKENNKKWFTDTFMLNRITKWNGFHFSQTYQMGSKNPSNAHTFFVEKLLDEIFSEGWEKNPIAIQKRVDLKSIMSFDNREDPKEKIVEEIYFQEQISLEKELEFVKIYDIPALNRQLLENVQLYRDIGLLFEYPSEVSIHIILKFIMQPENNLAVGKDIEIRNTLIEKHTKEFEGKNGSRINYRHCNEIYEEICSQITRKDLLVSTLILKDLKNEVNCNLEVQTIQYLEKATRIIKEKAKNSIVNLFYMKQETNNLIEVVRSNYARFPRKNMKRRIVNDENINALLKYLSESESGLFIDVQNQTKMEKQRAGWAQKGAEQMKRLWNYSPFERKVKQILDNPEDYAIGNLNEVVIIKAVKTLFSKAWKPLRLQSAMIETCQLAEFETYTKELSDLFDQCFGCLLV